MTYAIIQWGFNLHPPLVIGKQHHLAFIKLERDAFSLFASKHSHRETWQVVNTAPPPIIVIRYKGLGRF